MPLSRRQFILDAALAAAAWPFALRAQDASAMSAAAFRHGVASGDPLADRVVLWTRVTLPVRTSTARIDVRWRIADDEKLTRVVASGTAQTGIERDFTVKVDAGDLRPDRTYLYAFDAGRQHSPIGRTRTLPARGVDRLKLAVVSCSNYPVGYFNAYRCIANRLDLDAVVHLGDYIYESFPRPYGDPSGSGRLPLPAGEARSLDDYRLRYAIYRSDVDLQAVHGQHPFIAVWDDHESANDSWSGGIGRLPIRGWTARQAAAYRAYLEWMPVREAQGSGIRLYRSFRFGDVADLVMLDTRGLRDRHIAATYRSAIRDPKRTILGRAQEIWLGDQLRASQSGGTAWRVLGQQVLFSSIAQPGTHLTYLDAWDAYPQARARVLDLIEQERIQDVAILTGDIHSSWAFDVPRDPWSPPGSPASRSLATELATPAISSEPFFADPLARAEAARLRRSAAHLKFMEGERRGYVLLDVTRERMLAEWYLVPSVAERSAEQSKAAGFVSERGSARLVPA